MLFSFIYSSVPNNRPPTYFFKKGCNPLLLGPLQLRLRPPPPSLSFLTFSGKNLKKNHIKFERF